MRLQPSSAVFRDIWERGDATILRRTEVITSLTGASSVSPGISPPAGLRWLILHVGFSCRFGGGPAGGDIGDTRAQVLTGGNERPLGGMTVDDTLGVFERERGLDAFLVLDEDDTFRVRGNAITAIVSVISEAMLFGFEYVPIS